MLKGTECIVHRETSHKDEGYKGFIACEPQLHQESMDFWVLVLADGGLHRVDTDFIVIPATCAKQAE